MLKWLEDAGVDAFHISTGGAFPHPRSPPGSIPVADLAKTYGRMISSGIHGFRNLVLMRTWPFSAFMQWYWDRPAKGREEGINLHDTDAVKQAVDVPVICAGGFQSASVIRNAIEHGRCDAVSMARALLANPTLPRMFAEGLDRAPRPCTYSNKCLVNFWESPLGCYDATRFDSREEMLHEIMSVFEQPAFEERRASSRSD